jgi:hypothetical protein
MQFREEKMKQNRTVTKIITNKKALRIIPRIKKPLQELVPFYAYFGISLSMDNPVATALSPRVLICAGDDQIHTISFSPRIPLSSLDGAVNLTDMVKAAKVWEKENDLDPPYAWLYAIESAVASILAPRVAGFIFQAVPGYSATILATITLSGKQYKCKREAFAWHEFLHYPYEK